MDLNTYQPFLNVPDVVVYGIVDKVPGGSLDHGCLCGNPCGAYRAACRTHSFRNDSQHEPRPFVLLFESSLEHMVLILVRLPTSDSLAPADRNVIASCDPGNWQGREYAQPHVSRASIHCGSSRQRLARNRRLDSSSASPLLGQTSVLDVRGFACRMVCIFDIAGRSDALCSHMLGIYSLGLASCNHITRLSKVELNPDDEQRIRKRTAQQGLEL